MGTDIFQFGPLGAKIIGFKEGWGLKSLCKKSGYVFLCKKRRKKAREVLKKKP